MFKNSLKTHIRFPVLYASLSFNSVKSRNLGGQGGMGSSCRNWGQGKYMIKINYMKFSKKSIKKTKKYFNLKWKFRYIRISYSQEIVYFFSKVGFH